VREFRSGAQGAIERVRSSRRIGDRGTTCPSKLSSAHTRSLFGGIGGQMAKYVARNPHAATPEQRHGRFDQNLGQMTQYVARIPSTSYSAHIHTPFGVRWGYAVRETPKSRTRAH
jgi:hypothetical protein